MKNTVSVALAAYNGERYIGEQLESILMQLDEKDEVVVSLNDSNDKTKQILDDYQRRDSRIKIYECKEKGIIPNFENAIRHSKNEIVFLSDQDDVWEKDKIRVVLKSFDRDKEVMAVMHDCFYYDSNLKTILGSAYQRKVYDSTFLNIIRNSFQGSCMAFRRRIIDAVCPIPRNIAMHDQWIGIVAKKIGKIDIIPDKLIKYRRHENVMSPDDKRVGMALKIKYIIAISVSLVKRSREIHTVKG